MILLPLRQASVNTLDPLRLQRPYVTLAVTVTALTDKASNRLWHPSNKVATVDADDASPNAPTAASAPSASILTIKLDRQPPLPAHRGGTEPGGFQKASWILDLRVSFDGK